ncbi:DUF488 domain-containing protein [Christensenella tenuis]|jgi:uncharacterized protein YeaO (DUF488 family)|uniref:DUF488 family protein n=1 Tax=Christensenella tenuis TaxID=2763033 RepID=A0ABR7EGX0_9FIRM|nr:DUF488 family protein [Christensenella tenuis]MBC5648379.1 DUF488 family protein [Christensenella tenuis]
MLKLKRVYEGAGEEDGFRILADRLWPRGESKEKAAIDLWEKEIAPTPGLRKWFGHTPEKFPEFRKKYIAELERNPALEPFLTTVRNRAAGGNVTLVYAAKDSKNNDAVVLKEYLEERLKEGGA